MTTVHDTLTPAEIGVVETIHFLSIGSTNTYALERKGWSRDGISVIIADRQTAGRGQRGNLFESAGAHGLWTTLVVPVPNLDSPFQLNRTLAMALYDTVKLHAPQEKVAIKWPNDILLNGRKVCGLLLESFDDSGWFIAAGFGLNVSQSEMDFYPELRSIATSIRIETGKDAEKNGLLQTVLSGLRYHAGMTESDVHAGYCHRLAGVGCRVVIGSTQGVFSGVDSEGRALLFCENGSVEVLASGPLRFVPPSNTAERTLCT